MGAKFKDYVQASEQPIIMVVHRIDASSRRVENHDALVTALKQTFPTCTIRIFVGRDHDIEDTVKWFGEADVLLAPHGAALGFMPFLRPGRMVVEFGYTGGGMSFPGSFYHAIALSVSAKFFLHMADGSYSGPMTVDIEDVVLLTQWALGNVTVLRVGERAWPE